MRGGGSLAHSQDNHEEYDLRRPLAPLRGPHGALTGAPEEQCQHEGCTVYVNEEGVLLGPARLRCEAVRVSVPTDQRAKVMLV